MGGLNETGLARRRLGSWLRTVFYVIVFAVLVTSVASQWEQVQAFTWEVKPAGVISAAALLVIYYLGRGLIWAWSVRALALPMPYDQGVRIYLMSVLARYLPGGFWPFATVAASSSQLGLTGSLPALVLVVNILVLMFVNALLALPLIGVLLPPALVRLDWLLALVVIAGLGMGPLVLRWSLHRVARWRGIAHVDIKGLASPRQFLRLLVAFGVMQAILTLLYTLLIASLTPATTGQVLYLGIAYVNAWFVGLVILFVPQGIGVRESVFVLLAQPVLPTPVAIALSLAIRLFTLVVDLVLLVSLLVIGSRTRARSAPS